MTKVPKVKECAFSAHYFITAENQIILDPPPLSAGDDELGYSLIRRCFICSPVANTAFHL
jgi:hypothetical protein